MKLEMKRLQPDMDSELYHEYEDIFHGILNEHFLDEEDLLDNINESFEFYLDSKEPDEVIKTIFGSFEECFEYVRDNPELVEYSIYGVIKFYLEENLKKHTTTRCEPCVIKLNKENQVKELEDEICDLYDEEALLGDLQSKLEWNKNTKSYRDSSPEITSFKKQRAEIMKKINVLEKKVNNSGKN